MYCAKPILYVGFVQYTATTSTRDPKEKDALSPKTSFPALPRRAPAALTSSVEWILPLVMLVPIAIAAWAAYLSNRFVLSMVPNGTLLDTTAVSWYVTLLCMLLGGAYGQKLVEISTDLPPIGIKNTLALSSGFIVGASFNFVGNMVITYCYIVYCISQIHV